MDDTVSARCDESKSHYKDFQIFLWSYSKFKNYFENMQRIPGTQALRKNVDKKIGIKKHVQSAFYEVGAIASSLENEL